VNAGIISDHGIVAPLALFMFILLAFAVLFAKKPEDAVMGLVLFALMFLPHIAHFKLPKFPELNKDTLPYLVLFFPYLIRRFRHVARARLGRGVDFLIVITMVAAIFTVYTNRDALTVGLYRKVTMPGLDLNDGLSLAMTDLLMMGVPFVLGRLVVRGEREGTKLLQLFALGGLVYSLFILFEVRMSPQLHRWIYGFHAREDFSQVMRWGGYRPVVFMHHGLATALFVFNTAIAAFILMKMKTRIRGLPAKPVAWYLMFILLVCKSTGAIIYGLLVAPLLLFTRPKTQLRVAFIAAVLVVAYPSLRSSDLFPVNPLVSAFHSLSPERADSLEFRFDNEDKLLAKARQRVYFGWGSYGRNLIYDEWAKESSVTDGYWIIVLGWRGAVGAIAAFGLLLLPVYIAYRKRRLLHDRKHQILIAGLSLMVVITVVDHIPNGLFSNYPYFMSGALLGLVRALTRPGSQEGPVAEGPPPEEEDDDRDMILAPDDPGLLAQQRRRR
jgi:hypothetical protein